MKCHVTTVTAATVTYTLCKQLDIVLRPSGKMVNSSFNGAVHMFYMFTVHLLLQGSAAPVHTPVVQVRRSNAFLVLEINQSDVGSCYWVTSLSFGFHLL